MAGLCPRFTVIGASDALFSYLWARWSIQLGRLRTLLCGALCFAIVFGLFLIVANVEALSLGVMMMAGVIMGMADAAFQTQVSVYIVKWVVHQALLFALFFLILFIYPF